MTHKLADFPLFDRIDLQDSKLLRLFWWAFLSEIANTLLSAGNRPIAQQSICQSFRMFSYPENLRQFRQSLANISDCSYCLSRSIVQFRHIDADRRLNHDYGDNIPSIVTIAFLQVLL